MPNRPLFDFHAPVEWIQSKIHFLLWHQIINPCFSSSNEDFEVWPMHVPLQNWKWSEDAHWEGPQGIKPFPIPKPKISLTRNPWFVRNPCNQLGLRGPPLTQPRNPGCLQTWNCLLLLFDIHLIFFCIYLNFCARWRLAKTGRAGRLMEASTGEYNLSKKYRNR